MAFGEIAGETPEDRLIRLCHIACTWAEVKFCGVRDGLCYFEVSYDSDSDDSDDLDRPHAILSIRVPGEGLTGETAVEQLIEQIAAEIERNEL
jgi:hypothetical protein